MKARMYWLAVFLHVMVLNTHFWFIEAQEHHGPSRMRRVIGGHRVTEGEWPWLVSLKGKIVTKRLFGVFPIQHRTVYCGGSVVNNRWILTAAHCFDGGREARRTGAWEARLATVSIQGDIIDKIKHILGKIFNRRDWLEWDIDVEKIVLHEQYDKHTFWKDDIALIKLEDSIPDYAAIRTISLPVQGDNFFPALNATCIITGWGCTNAGSTVSKRAMQVHLPIFDGDICANYYGIQDMTNRLCAGFMFSSRGICPGDSGGPLVCPNENGQYVQVGITSFTSRDSPGSYPGVFTQVSGYMDWINNVINNN